ncbi:DUF3168 domain-containing protein [Actinoplanes sp. N902-109]|uniref:DUF3168 domain-containing protein n=1 Tax=Actinoplanes sp. (strain N902-109) TaxID=649831 RepID=UPI0003294A27|nr:DUF3168 domain-containing protein [Actinoplanes sp. N902-109]AGL13878.1 hypothetical protein L083_0368 [Actinoplanes sp. N902-109]
MSGQDHAAAILAKLDADDASPPLVVLDGFVPTGTLPPYVVVYFDYDAPPAETDSQASNLVMASLRRDVLAYCHSVATTARGARAVAARAEAALLDQVLTVPGRTCWPIRRTEGQPARRDETTGTAIFDVVDVYRLSSTPA